MSDDKNGHNFANTWFNKSRTTSKNKEIVKNIKPIDNEEKEIAEKYVAMLRERNFDVATTIREFKNFYEAEDYHQDYYAKKGSMPYCHFYTKLF